MPKAKYGPDKNHYICPPPCESEMEECPDHPDLYLLRDAAADERGAIADYLECALKTCLDEVFLDVAEDEMHHYVELMRLISRLDPVQAEMLEEEDLDFLVMNRAFACKPKCEKHKPIQEEQDVEVILPDKEDMPAIRCLTKAIQDELHAINKYQKYMDQAENPCVKQLFCHIMNEEKEHVAEFTAALFEITREPLPEEDH